MEDNPTTPPIDELFYLLHEESGHIYSQMKQLFSSVSVLIILSLFNKTETRILNNQSATNYSLL